MSRKPADGRRKLPVFLPQEARQGRRWGRWPEGPEGAP